MHIPKIPNIWGFFEFIFSKSHVLTFLCKKSLNTLVKRKKMCYNFNMFNIENELKKLPQKALTKTFWYPMVKQIGKVLGMVSK